MRILLMLIAITLTIKSYSQEYLRTDGSNEMTGPLKIKSEDYSSIELESNTGAYIDFKNDMDSDYDGRIIWNKEGSERFDIYGETYFKNLVRCNHGISGSYIRLSNELQMPSGFEEDDPIIGLNDNSGFGINIHSTYGIGFFIKRIP